MGGGAGAQQATAADLKGGALGGDVEGLSPLPSSLDQEVERVSPGAGQAS